MKVYRKKMVAMPVTCPEKLALEKAASQQGTTVAGLLRASVQHLLPAPRSLPRTVN